MLQIQTLTNETLSPAKLAASPVLRWAGGKTQLLPTLRQHYPQELGGTITTYAEPFIGGGAVFFDIANNYPIEKAFLFDINHDLVSLYSTLKKNVEGVIHELSLMEEKFIEGDVIERESYYYELRQSYNTQPRSKRLLNEYRAAQTIFLNKTCFNGLFRVNASGNFNVPYGRPNNPKILCEPNLLAVSNILQIAEIKCGDFDEVSKHVHDRTFVYYDPPYRPVSETSYFTAYSKKIFDDMEQKRLAQFFGKMDKIGVKQLLSNSKTGDNEIFFREIYAGYEMYDALAKRSVASNPARRGYVEELLIRNY